MKSQCARRLRLRADAILIGAETLRQDNPRLTLRDADIGTGKEQPWRVVLTRSGRLPADAQTVVGIRNRLADALRDTPRYRNDLVGQVRRGVELGLGGAREQPLLRGRGHALAARLHPQAAARQLPAKVRHDRSVRPGDMIDAQLSASLVCDAASVVSAFGARNCFSTSNAVATAAPWSTNSNIGENSEQAS